MRWHRHVWAAVAALIFSSLDALAAEPERRSMTHAGLERTVLVVNASQGRTLPLVVVLHGRRDPGAPHRTSVELDRLAVSEGFVAVYPAARDGAWAVPLVSQDGDARSDAIDDLGFLTGLIDRLVGEGSADASRVYVSGASLGGMMTYALMCAASERLAAAAPLIANMTVRQLETCRPAHAVPAILIAGTADRLMPYYGRDERGVRLASIPDTVNFWAGVSGCRHQSSTPLSTPGDWLKAGGVATSRIEWTRCEKGGEVRLYRVDGGGHTLPSRRPQTEAEAKRNGPRSAELETSEEVWAFFKRFHR